VEEIIDELVEFEVLLNIVQIFVQAVELVHEDDLVEVLALLDDMERNVIAEVGAQPQALLPLHQRFLELLFVAEGPAEPELVDQVLVAGHEDALVRELHDGIGGDGNDHPDLDSTEPHDLRQQFEIDRVHANLGGPDQLQERVVVV